MRAGGAAGGLFECGVQGAGARMAETLRRQLCSHQDDRYHRSVLAQVRDGWMEDRRKVAALGAWICSAIGCLLPRLHVAEEEKKHAGSEMVETLMGCSLWSRPCL